MTAVDALGYLAASLVLATFCAKSMVTLRLLAIASNAAFITYALATGLYPIVVLHTVMLPLNLLRLRQVLRSSVRLSPDAGGAHLVAAPVVAVTGAQMQVELVDNGGATARAGAAVDVTRRTRPTVAIRLSVVITAGSALFLAACRGPWRTLCDPWRFAELITIGNRRTCDDYDPRWQNRLEPKPSRQGWPLAPTTG